MAVHSNELRQAPPSAGELGRRATVRDVARVAGVSKSTVSRAISNRGYVAAPVRDRVLEAAKNLGYVPDVTARNLKARTSGTLGVIVSDLRNSFYADLAYGAGLAARKAGYTMMLADDQGAAATELEVAESMVSLRVSGVVIAPLGAEVTTFLQRHGIPVIEVDRQFSETACDGVVVDNRRGARRLTEHLIGLGHRRISLIIDETNWTTGRDRFAGYQDALLAAGIDLDPDLVRESGWAVSDSERVAAAVLAGPQAPTAVFAANNVIAEGVWRAAMRIGFAVPGTLSIVSFDDSSWMSMVNPGITVVSQDAVAIGDAAVERLIGRLVNPDAVVRTVVLPIDVILRGSAGPVPTH